MKRLEQEYKWQVPCKAFFKVFRKAFSDGTKVNNIVRYSITDKYFDNNSCTLSRAQSALRLRKSNKQYEFTILIRFIKHCKLKFNFSIVFVM